MKDLTITYYIDLVNNFHSDKLNKRIVLDKCKITHEQNP